MPGKKGAFLKYSEEAMAKAGEDVRMHKTSFRKAAKAFGVPRQTLINKVLDKRNLSSRYNTTTYLLTYAQYLCYVSTWFV